MREMLPEVAPTLLQRSVVDWPTCTTAGLMEIVQERGVSACAINTKRKSDNTTAIQKIESFFTVLIVPSKKAAN